jgi:hypothetical protein
MRQESLVSGYDSVSGLVPMRPASPGAAEPGACRFVSSKMIINRRGAARQWPSRPVAISLQLIKIVPLGQFPPCCKPIRKAAEIG